MRSTCAISLLMFLLVIAESLVSAESTNAVVNDCNFSWIVQQEIEEDFCFTPGETVRVVIQGDCFYFIAVLVPLGEIEYYGEGPASFELLPGQYYIYVVYGPVQWQLSGLAAEFVKFTGLRDNLEYKNRFSQRIKETSHLKVKTKTYNFHVE